MAMLTGEGLSHRLRKICDVVKARLWIAVPFIGDLKAVTQLLGNRWIKRKLDVRLLTDIENAAYLNNESLQTFRRYGTIKTLLGLHAKIYIADNRAILTSANLTRTAFAKRIEAGIEITSESIDPLIEQFEEWWREASGISRDWFQRHQTQTRAKLDRETKDGISLPERYLLPADPERTSPKIAADFRDFPRFIEVYRHFAGQYANVARLWPNAPLFLETDSFLDYLFHHARGCPSSNYRLRRTPVPIYTASVRQSLLERHILQHARWVKNREDSRWRERFSNEIRTLLKPQQIDNISRAEVKEVVDRLNCMHSIPLNKARFLNPENNSLKTIRKAWKELLHGEKELPKRMTDCHKVLRWFGRSSIQELLGFYSPKEYPLRNSNSEAGLRLFGYDVKVQ